MKNISTCTVSIVLLLNLFVQAQPLRETLIQQKASKLAQEFFQNGKVKGTSNGFEPDALAEKHFTGAANDQLGFSVSTAGDINGDGYSDVIVGAFQNSAGGTYAGRAYIFFGGPLSDDIADVILTGAAANDWFGFSVSTAGDVNGDGYSDVIIGAPYNSAGGLNAGRAYIYYGGSTMNNIADVILTGEAAGDQFGYSVSTAGDVNGDGYSDVIVGAPRNAAGGINAGKAYLYYGGSTTDNIADVIFNGIASDYFGYSVSLAGDVNGDGYSDVIVGAPINSGGRAYIYFGGSAMNNTADVTLTGAALGDQFGSSVSTAGDVNGDGYSDVVIGAPTNGAGGTYAGRAYIYFGGSAMNNTADVTLSGTAGDMFGHSVSLAGDVNGDGYSDVIIGAPYNSAGGANAGRAYIYFGAIKMDNIADIILIGAKGGNLFGWSVSSAGDINGDGYSDPIVGAPYNDAGGVNAGRAYLYLNSLTGADIPDEFYTGAAAGDISGFSVSTAGDVNGDGYSDVIVGAPGNDAGGLNAGRVYIFFGGPFSHNSPDLILTGAAAGDNFGYSVSTAGDVNGDGYSDVIVGAPYNSTGGSSAGRAYVYYGGSTMDNIADVTLTGAATGDQFGFSVSTAGDVNGDGYSDVIVGAPYNSTGGSSAGRAYIYFGGSAMDNIADIIFTGAAAGDQLGYSVSTAGDVNGDGYSDVIVGAPLNDAAGSNAGSAYIYYGGSTMDNIADVILNGEAANNYLGFSVSTAGDVNGDGYSDVIVGAYGNSAGGSGAGRAYIYYGGSIMDKIADVTLTGESLSWFGFSVSTAGDVNGDGFSDVIVGALYNNAGGTEAGRAYVYFGGSTMDNTADIILTGTTGEYLGYSVSTAGDLNGDGYSDVVVGAIANGAGGTNAGRTYLYLSSAPPVKPRIAFIKDVPSDQGGYVNLQWVRSSYDAKGINKITDYLIQRSFPPGLNGFAWENISIMPASHESFYSFVAQTPSDSMINNSGTFYFRITARTANDNEYWRSNIMSGHSTDNLAPSAVLGFYAGLIGGNVKLAWKANSEKDLKNYLMYRTSYPNANPDTLTPLSVVTDTIYTDSNPLSGTSYYYIRASDIHNNLSAPVTTTSNITGINDKIFPIEYTLTQNYPNPFNPSTTIKYQLLKSGLATLKVYDILGKEIATLINENKNAGYYEISFDASQLASGIYIYQLKANDFVSSKKMILIK